MAFRDISLTVQNFFDSLVSCVKDPEKYNRYIWLALYGLICAILVTTAFVGKNWYIASRERSAEKDLSSYITQYHNAMSSENASWGQIASLFAVGYAQHARSYLAPYFLMYQADALLQEKNFEEALSVMKKALDEASESNAFYELMRTKYYLMILDIPEHSEHDQALKVLYEIGSDKTNNFFEIALFYLARYHFVHHNLEEARTLWQELCATAVDENPSPFVQEAEEYLQLVG